MSEEKQNPGRYPLGEPSVLDYVKSLLHFGGGERIRIPEEEQLSVGGERGAVGSDQLSVGSEQLVVGSEQVSVDGGQLSVGSGQLTEEKAQAAGLFV